MVRYAKRPPSASAADSHPHHPFTFAHDSHPHSEKSSQSWAPPRVPGCGPRGKSVIPGVEAGLAGDGMRVRAGCRAARVPRRPGTACAALAATYGAVQGDKPPQAGRETTRSAP
jgi:hypothetical protein